MIQKGLTRMISKYAFLLGSFSALVLTTACSSITGRPAMEDARYWQRQSTSSALYMRGPKAQQILHQDIADCTNDIRELERLGAIRKAIPTNYNHGNTMEQRTAAKAELGEWDTPERDGYLYAEHMDYHDFETCMYSKGWERVEYLSHTDIDKARDDYLENMGYKRKHGSFEDRENVTSLNPAQQNPPPYKDLNE